jgi:hypothetical protein
MLVEFGGVVFGPSPRQRFAAMPMATSVRNVSTSVTAQVSGRHNDDDDGRHGHGDATRGGWG